MERLWNKGGKAWTYEYRSAGIFVSGDGKQPRDSRCRSPPDFSLHGEFCKLNLQEVNNGI